MKKFSLALLALAAALAITPAALADSLCPNTAQTGGFGATYSNVSGPNGTCGAGTAVTMSLTNDKNEAKLYWSPGAAGYPTGLTLGNLPGINASVSFSPGTGGDQPYFMFSFTNPGDSFLNTTTGDEILLIEFQPNGALSGPGDNTLAFNPATTEFNLYDNTLNKYLETGQQDAHTLDYWLLHDPSLKGDSVREIEIAMGLAGSVGNGESLTVDSVDVTPEPSSLLLLGTGLVGLAFLAFRKGRRSGRAPLSLPS